MAVSAVCDSGIDGLAVTDGRDTRAVVPNMAAGVVDSEIGARRMICGGQLE